MKKIIALLLAVLMLVGVLAGCGKNDTNADQSTTPTEESKGVADTEKAGSLVVTANASVVITYGTDGLVLDAEGLNEEGINLLESYEEPTGFSCTELVTQVIKDSAARTNLGHLTYVVVKIDKDSKTPGTNFMDSIESAAKKAVEEAAPHAKLVMIKQENLDADGNIDLATVKTLVEAYLEVEKLDGIVGADKPVEGIYSFTVTYGGFEEFVQINANTGIVGEGDPSDEPQEPEETEPDEELDLPEDPTQESEPVDNIPVEDETTTSGETED
ncbi:MAG: hypothetical protein IJZ56_01250 [Oscillospiraceae bacterium]|nr:hypothetical protein [Oscillospiraceae bacterium]